MNYLIKRQWEASFLNPLKSPAHLYQLTAQLGSQILGFLFSITLVRISGVEISGEYFSLLAIMNMSTGVVASGIRTNYYRNGVVSDFSLALSSIFISNFGLLIIIIPFILYLGYNFKNIIFLNLISLLMNYLQMHIALLRLQNLDKKLILSTTTPPVLLLLLIVVFKPNNFNSLTTIALIAWSAILIYIVFDLKRLLLIPKLNLKKLIRYVYISGILIGTTVLTQIYGNFDIILLKKLLGNEASGLYKIAISITMIVLPTIGIFAFVYLSEITKCVRDKDYVGLIKKKRQQYFLTVTISIVFIVFSILLNKYIIYFLYKVNSPETVVASIVLSISVLFNVLAMVSSYTLIAIKKEKLILRVLLIATIVNIMLNILLVNKFGLIGASFANTITQAFIFGTYFFILKKELNKLVVA